MEHLSRIVAGLWRVKDWGLEGARLADWVEGCLDLGITTFDLAEVYAGHACHELFGSALRATPTLRDRLRIVTKCNIRVPHERRPEVRRHHYDSSRAQILDATERALRELGTDRVEVLLLHRSDPLLDPREVAAAFRELASAGKALSFGVSNFRPSQVDLLRSAGVEVVVHQVEGSVLCLDAFEDGVLAQCLAGGVAPMAWSPLGGGRLFDGGDDQARRVMGVLKEIGEARGVEPVVVAFAFLLGHPAGWVPVTGSGKLERVGLAVEALQVELTREEWFDIWTASTGQPLP